MKLSEIPEPSTLLSNRNHYRMAKTHGIPYLQKSLSTNEPWKAMRTLHTTPE